jgi:hypothetical protein
VDVDCGCTARGVYLTQLCVQFPPEKLKLEIENSRWFTSDSPNDRIFGRYPIGKTTNPIGNYGKRYETIGNYRN